MEVDYIIVGQGLCGSFLSYYLMQAGKKILVIDESKPFTASKVASGVINPVTGRRIVRTWMIETLQPFALSAYTALGNELGCTLISQRNILDFHPTPQMMLAFAERIPEETEYLRQVAEPSVFDPFFQFYFGIGEINPCYLVDISTLIDRWRAVLLQQNSIWETRFEQDALQLNKEANGGISYNGVKATKIIFCDGCDGAASPFFQLLPYARNKGEAIIASIPDLPRQHVYKQGINLVPWKENLWWIGSTYDWNFTDLLPSAAFHQKVTTQLKLWLKLPFQIEDHIASERPANMERRPFVGFHPQFPSVGLLNGMGTKGCTLAPYFANQLAEYLTQGTPLLPQADVQRFSKILSRGAIPNHLQ